MWCGKYIRKATERVLGRLQFPLKHVNCSPRNLSGRQRFNERGFINNWTTSRIDKKRRELSTSLDFIGACESAPLRYFDVSLCAAFLQYCRHSNVSLEDDRN